MALRYWPVPKGTVVTSGFRPAHRPNHHGIDLDWNKESRTMPVYAAQAGTVIQVGAASGYGGPDPHGWLRIDHSTAQGGGETVYGHITRLPHIRVGSRVQAGEQIATTNPNRGTNGGVEAHLHFEVHPWTFSPGKQINPMAWLKDALWPGDEPPTQDGFDAKALGDAMGWSLSLARYEQLLPAYLKMLDIVGAKTVNQHAMIAAQLGHESVGLKYQEEIASGAAYEWRKDLGNVYAGDGVRFKGHGWIQVTGRHNHTACSKWAYARGIVPTADYFVRDPEALGSDEYCWVGPAWYLTQARPQFMAAADRGELENCTRQINGGLNGLADRRTRWNRARNMGTRLIPEEGLTMAQIDDLKKLIESEGEKTRKHTEAWIKGFIGPIGADTKDIRQQLVGARDAIAGDLAASYPGWDFEALAKTAREKQAAGQGLTQMDALALAITPEEKEAENDQSK